MLTMLGSGSEMASRHKDGSEVSSDTMGSPVTVTPPQTGTQPTPGLDAILVPYSAAKA